MASAQDPVRLRILDVPPNSPSLSTVWNSSIFASYSDPGPEQAFVENATHLALVRITDVEEAMQASTNMQDYVRLLREGVSSNEVRLVSERGGHPMAILARMPDWLSSSTNRGRRLPTDPYTISQASPPASYQLWAELVSNTVAHLNGRLGVDVLYEVWNEPNSPGFWQGSQTAYLELYRATVLGARAADPQARVGGPTVSFHTGSIGTNTSPLIRELLHYAASNAIPNLGLARLPVGFISWHEFGTMPDVTLSNRADDVRAWMAEAGGFPGTKLIIDEWQISDPELPPGIDGRRDTEFAAAYSAAMIGAMARGGIDYQCMASFQDFLAVSNLFYGGYGMLTRVPQVVRKSSYHVHELLDAFAGATDLPSEWPTPLTDVQAVQLGTVAGQAPGGSEWLVWCFTPPSNMLMQSSCVQVIDRMRQQDPASLDELLAQANASDTAELLPLMQAYLEDPDALDPIVLDPYWEDQFVAARALSVAMMAALTNRLTLRIDAPAYSNVAAAYTYRLIDDRHANAYSSYQQALSNGLNAAVAAAASNQFMTVTAEGELTPDGALPIDLDVGPFSVHWISVTTNGVTSSSSTSTTTTDSTTTDSTSTTSTSTTTSTTSSTTTTALVLAGPDVRYVRGAATGLSDGTSWVNAYTNLQEALDAVSAPAELWVAAGPYRPGALPTDTFRLKADVAVYGGFVGAEVGRAQRNWRVTLTILSGDLAGDDGAGGANRSDNAAHLVTGASGATLDGFVLRGGHAPAGQFGGAMRIDGVAMTIRNCVFVDNAAHSGGALFLDNGATPLFADCVFSGNSAYGEYAGVAYGDHAAFPEFRRCVFAGNRTPEHGGVFYTGGLSGWSLQMFNCLLAGNYAGWEGGVAYFRHAGANPQIGNCTLAANTRAMYINGNLGGCNVKFYSGIFWTNTQYQFVIHQGSTGRLQTSYTDLQQAPNYNVTNTIRVDPRWVGVVTAGTWTADGVYDAARGQSELADAGAVWAEGVFAGLTVLPDAAHAEALQFVVASNLAQHLYVWGDVSSVRGLANAGDAYRVMDYRLQTNSPCIDTGMPVPWWNEPTRDADGAVRPWGLTYDMGAYESGAPRPPPLPDPLLIVDRPPVGLILLVR